LIAGWGDEKEDRISEREYQGRLESLLKSAFNTQLQPLRSLEIKHDGFRLMVRPAALSTR